MKTAEPPAAVQIPLDPVEDAPPAKRPFFRRPAVILLLLAAAIAGVVFGAVVLLHALTHETTDDAFIDGNVVSIAPKIAGKVLSVRVTDNQAVKKGDPLFTIDPADCQALVEQRKAALEVALAKQGSADASVRQSRAHVKTIELAVQSAQASADEAQASASLAKADFERSKSLSGGGVISKQDYDHSFTGSVTAIAVLQSKVRQVDAAVAYVTEARTMADSAVAEAAAARASVAQAKAALAEAQLQLSYTQPVAPEEGIVTNKAVEAGDYVQVGQTLAAIVPHRVWVTANFKETQITAMRRGQPVEVGIDAYPGRKLKGHVDSIQAGSGARFSLLPPENATGNFVKVVQRVPVKILLDGNPEEGEVFGPGMSVVPDVRVRDGVAAAFVVTALAAAAIVALVIGGLFLLAKARRG